MGIEVRFVDAEDPASFEQVMDGNTRAFFCETVSNVCIHVKYHLSKQNDTIHRYEIHLSYFFVIPSTVSLPKPALEVCDLETIADVAHSHGLPVIVEN